MYFTILFDHPPTYGYVFATILSNIYFKQDWKNQSQKAAQVRKVKKKKKIDGKKEKKTELNKTGRIRNDRK